MLRRGPAQADVLRALRTGAGHGSGTAAAPGQGGGGLLRRGCGGGGAAEGGIVSSRGWRRDRNRFLGKAYFVSELQRTGEAGRGSGGIQKQRH